MIRTGSCGDRIAITSADAVVPDVSCVRTEITTALLIPAGRQWSTNTASQLTIQDGVMGLWKIEVGVAITRPPTPANTRTVYVTVLADNWMEAELTAIDMAITTRKVVMPVSTLITDWPEDEH